MDQYTLLYNPYQSELTFMRLSCSKPEICFSVTKRLQDAFQEGIGDNWPGLIPKMIKSANNSFSLDFCGRQIDYDDLFEMIETHNMTESPYKIKLSFQSKFESDNIVNNALQKIRDIQSRHIPQIDARKRELDAACLKIQDEAMEVNVIGLYSSGKSTLINSLLRAPLLPMNVKVTSNKVVEIIHDPKRQVFIGKAINEKGETVKQWTALTPEIVKEWNDSADIEKIEIRGRIPFVPAGRNLIIRDTPGYGNADSQAHHDEMVDGLANTTAANAMFLFLMTPDTYQGGSKNEQDSRGTVKGLLKTYADRMQRFGKEFRDKFIFVLTYADELADQTNTDMEDEMEEFRHKLAEYGIQDPMTVPVNSKLALLIYRKLQDDAFTPAEKLFLANYQLYNDPSCPAHKFEKYSTISPTGVKEINAKIQQIQHSGDQTAEYQEAIIHCGIPVLEQTVLDFWDKYLIPKRIYEAVSQIQAICQDVFAKLNFFQSLTENKEKLTFVQKQLADAEKRKTKIQQLRNETLSEMQHIQFYVNADEWKKKAEIIIFELTKSFQKDGKVRIESAKDKIESYKSAMQRIIMQLESALRSETENSFLNRANDLYIKYKTNCQQILNIQIGDLPVRKLSGFSEFTIHENDVKSLIQQHKSAIYKTVTRKNPERKGFFGWFKFWKPWTIEETKLDGYVVDLSAALTDPMNKAVTLTWGEIDQSIQESAENLERIREFFTNELNKLQEVFLEAMEEMKVETRETNSIMKEITILKQNEHWAKTVSEQINSLWEG